MIDTTVLTKKTQKGSTRRITDNSVNSLYNLDRGQNEGKISTSVCSFVELKCILSPLNSTPLAVNIAFRSFVGKVEYILYPSTKLVIDLKVEIQCPYITRATHDVPTSVEIEFRFNVS